MRAACSGSSRRIAVVELHAGDLRHHQIAQDHVEALARARAGRAPRAPSVTAVDVVVGARKRRIAWPSDRLVVDDQHRAARAAEPTSVGMRSRDRRRHRRGATGSATRNSVPLPSSLSNVISPPSAVTIRCQIARPSPVPTPIGLVVKNGVNIRGLDLGRHAGAGVGDLDDDAAAGVERGRDADLVRLDVALGDRLRRVDDQVEEHLAEPRLVGVDAAGPSRSRFTSCARWRISFHAMRSVDSSTVSTSTGAAALLLGRARRS